MCVGQIRPTVKGPTIQKTQLGWIVTGTINNKLQVSTKQKRPLVNTLLTTSHSSEVNLNQTLTKFWQFENDLSNHKSWTPMERECEEQFLQTVKQNDEGRFIVKLPIKHNGLQQLGESRHTALTRFNNLERRFHHNEKLKQDYSQFMQEYSELNHMQLIDENKTKKGTVEFYLPHHLVFKETSITTKLRVVFDASCKSTSGLSLNDVLLMGPVVQSDLISILLKFRTFRYAFTADIIKMYRQILINDEQTSLQRVFWREHDDKPVSTYELKTLTYGTAPASYIATRCLKLLAEGNRNDLPLGSEAIINDFYVDDILSGANSLEEAIRKRNQVIAILKTGQFILNK